MDLEIERLCKAQYPETERLRAVRSVGPLTSLAFVLTIEDPKRFARSRSVPVYLGLVPRRDQAGVVDKQLRITKAGDSFLRRLLITSAHRPGSPPAPDSPEPNPSTNGSRMEQDRKR
jgi:transposase